MTLCKAPRHPLLENPLQFCSTTDCTHRLSLLYLSTLCSPQVTGCPQAPPNRPPGLSLVYATDPSLGVRPSYIFHQEAFPTPSICTQAFSNGLPRREPHVLTRPPPLARLPAGSLQSAPIHPPVLAVSQRSLGFHPRPGPSSLSTQVLGSARSEPSEQPLPAQRTGTRSPGPAPPYGPLRLPPASRPPYPVQQPLGSGRLRNGPGLLPWLQMAAGRWSQGVPQELAAPGKGREDQGKEKRVKGRAVGAGRLGLRETAPARNTGRDEGSQVLMVRFPSPNPAACFTPSAPIAPYANKSPKMECGMFIE